MPRIDTVSDTWAEVSTWANDRLKKARAALESDNANFEQVLVFRAQIKLLNRLLELPSKATPPNESEVAFGIDPQ